MSDKVSLRVVEGNEQAQTHITSQAMLFAELTRKEAKKNSLTQAQVIKDAHWEPSQGRYSGMRLTVTRGNS